MMKQRFCVLLVIVVLVTATDATVSFGAFQFCRQFGAIALQTADGLVSEACGTSGPFWQLSLSNAGNQTLQLDSLLSTGGGNCTVSNRTTGDVLSVNYTCAPFFVVTLSLSGEDYSALQLAYENTADAPTRLGDFQFPAAVVSAQLSFPLGRVGHSEARLFAPSGFGALHHRPFTMLRSNRHVYPSTSATMQFWLYTPSPSASATLYLATHDGSGSVKTFDWRVLSALQRRGVLDVHVPAALDPAVDAASAQHRWSLGYAVVVQSYAGADWWDGAQIYRRWAVQQALWLQRPTGGAVPQWFRDLQLIFNTGWSPYDVLAVDQGDPDVVVADAQTLRRLFPVETLALHWYVWQNVSNFDLDYPVYVPKAGFAQAVQSVQQQLAVAVMPYTNGRLYDTTLPSFAQHRQQMTYVAADGAATLRPPLSMHTESYGNGELFAVPCPALPFWHADTLPAVAGTLASQYGVAAVYIDQIAAANPVACMAGAQHGHANAGGSWWADSERLLLANCRSAAGAAVALVVENNAEPYVGAADGLLSIASWLVVGDEYVPAFMAVYGGYTMTVGRVFSPLDFAGDAAVLAAKCAQTFLYGSINGWFSLRGNIGVIDQLADPKHQPDVAFIAQLAAYRKLAADYFWSGRAMRTPQLVNASSTVPVIRHVDGRFLAIQTAAWATANSTAIFVVNCVQRQLPFVVTYPLDASAPSPLQLKQVDQNGLTTLYDDYVVVPGAYNVLQVTGTLAPRQLLMLFF